MSASLLVSCVEVATRPGLYPLAKETACAAPTLCTEYGPNGWMDTSHGMAATLDEKKKNCASLKLLNEKDLNLAYVIYPLQISSQSDEN